MSLTIDVPPEIERRIQQAAAQSRVSIQDYLRKLIEDAVNGTGESSIQSGADLVRAWRQAGVIGAWRNRNDAADSIALADRLGRDAQTRTHE